MVGNINDNENELTNKDIINLAKAYNNFVGEKIINYSNRNIQEIKKDLNKYIIENYNNISQKIIDELVKLFWMKKYGKVLGPRHSNDWLNNGQIESKMSFYEMLVPDYKFLGAVLADCDVVSSCKLYPVNIDDLVKNGKYRYGVIFNTSVHGQKGKHWISLYLDTGIRNNKTQKTPQIWFCNSLGKPPTKPMESFINKFKAWCKKNNKDYIYKENTKHIQTDNIECGVYSINFINRSLSGESFESIIEDSLDSKSIHTCRIKFFTDGINYNDDNETIDVRCDAWSAE